MRSFFTIVPLQRYRNAYRCPVTTEVNLESPSDPLHPLLHAGNAYTKFQPGLLSGVGLAGSCPGTGVADFQCEVRIAVNPYSGFVTSRMALDVGQALLHYSEQ